MINTTRCAARSSASSTRAVGASDALNALLTSRGTAEVRDGSPLIALLRRPQLTYDDLRDFDAGCRAFPPALAESVEIAVKV